MNFRELLLSGGVEEAAYKAVLKEIVSSNRKNVRVFSLVATAALAIMFILSFVFADFRSNRSIYLCFAIIMLLVHIVTVTVCKGNDRAMMYVTSCFVMALLVFGILIGTLTNPTELTAVYIAFMLAVPQLFIDRPWRMCLGIIAASICFVIMVLMFKDPMTWISDITNCIVFCIVSLILNVYMINTKVSRWCLEKQIRHMAENDQLTGLKNRYSYEKSIGSLAVLSSSSIFCVYVDVNGLHELNNKCGHEAGDRMLQYIGTAMQRIFGKDCTYRIGGDEYVALGSNLSEEEIQSRMAKLKSAAESAGYHVALGYSIKPKEDIEIDDIIREAEKKMFKDKSDYYISSGRDRRNRK